MQSVAAAYQESHNRGPPVRRNVKGRALLMVPLLRPSLPELERLCVTRFRNAVAPHEARCNTHNKSQDSPDDLAQFCPRVQTCGDFISSAVDLPRALHATEARRERIGEPVPFGRALNAIEGRRLAPNSPCSEDPGCEDDPHRPGHTSAIAGYLVSRPRSVSGGSG